MRNSKTFRIDSKMIMRYLYIDMYCASVSVLLDLHLGFCTDFEKEKDCVTNLHETKIPFSLNHSTDLVFFYLHLSVGCSCNKSQMRNHPPTTPVLISKLLES